MIVIPPLMGWNLSAPRTSGKVILLEELGGWDRHQPTRDRKNEEDRKDKAEERRNGKADRESKLERRKAREERRRMERKVILRKRRVKSKTNERKGMGDKVDILDSICYPLPY